VGSAHPTGLTRLKLLLSLSLARGQCPPYRTKYPKKVAVNACGFTIIPSLNMAEGFTAGDKSIVNESTPYDVSALPLVTTTPLCQNGVVYVSAP
jgi:hypothetical protein